MPKWVMSSFPFKEEEEALSGFIVPLVIFSFMGIGVMWYELFSSFSAILGIIISILIIILVFVIILWLIKQVDILRILRQRLELHYKNSKNEEEKLKTKERLSHLCVKVWYVRT